MTYAASLPSARHRAGGRATRAAQAREARATRIRRSPLAVRHLGIPEALTVVGLAAVLVVAPATPPAHAAARSASAVPRSVAGQPRFSAGETQRMKVSASARTETDTRDAIAATPGAQMLVAEGTNRAWAQLVMMYGGWPQTDANITVFLQWMRQENGPPDWWNRNNPLNNGWGSGGGAGFGSYDTLNIAAQKAAENLNRPLFAGIAACFAAGNGGCKDAIVASNWATSHYANGAHWSDRPVDIVKAPTSAWGQ